MTSKKRLMKAEPTKATSNNGMNVAERNALVGGSVGRLVGWLWLVGLLSH